MVIGYHGIVNRVPLFCDYIVNLSTLTRQVLISKNMIFGFPLYLFRKRRYNTTLTFSLILG